MSIINIYTDGSCNPKTKIGGWAFIAKIEKGLHLFSKSERNTTNNRMELTAIIEAIKYYSSKYKKIVIYSDSLLSINCASKLWKRKENLDLWKEYDITSDGKTIQFVKVLAHSGDEYNEMVDKLAKNEMIKETSIDCKRNETSIGRE